MKTQTIVTDITHDDLVTLMSAAMYGNNWCTIQTPKGSYKGTPLEDENDYLEDTWAKVLLAGKPLYFCDYYAEDNTDFYGDKKHEYKVDYDGDWYMQYEFTLKDIEDGLAKALDRNNYLSDYVRHITEDDGCNLDLNEADAVMQFIIFGEEIYG